jgi:hypothetical protein
VDEVFGKRRAGTIADLGTIGFANKIESMRFGS